MKKYLLLFFLSVYLVNAQEAVDVNKKAEEQWVFAEGLFGRTWYEDALKEYNLYLKNNPQSTNVQDARWRIYECYAKLGKDKEVLVALNQFIKKEKDVARKETARMNLARILFDAGNPQQALKIYETVDKKAGDGQLWESARYEAARIFLKKNNRGEAFLRLRELSALKFEGKREIRAYAIFAYSSLLSDKKQYAAAIEQYIRLTSVKGTPAEISENAWYNLGVLYFKNSKFADSAMAFNFVIENFPQSRFRESSINQTARCHIQQSKFLEATAALKELNESTGAIALERDYLLGYALWQLKDYKKAVVLFDVCINDKSDLFREEASYNKLNCLSESAAFDKAFTAAEAFLKAYPESVYLADAQYLAGINAEKLKNLKEAEKYFQLSLKSYSGDWPLIDNNYFALARVLAASGRYEEEAEVWTQLSGRRRSEYRESAMVRAVTAWVNAAKNSKALDMLEMYLREFPNGKDAFYAKNKITELYILEKDYGQAGIFLRDVLKSDGLLAAERSALLSVLGRVHYYQKEYDESIKILEACLKGEELSTGIKTDCLVYQGFSYISLDQESKGAKKLSTAFLEREDFSSLITIKEEDAIARLLEKYNYQKAAVKIYGRLAKSDERKIKITGLMGLARTFALDNPDKALGHLSEIIELCTAEDQLERVGALSVMGEVFVAQEKQDRALQTFETALKVKAGDEAAICRSLYGMAAILYERKEYDKARRYVNQVFILYKDPVYCPKAMFLAIKISVLLARKKDASQTALELNKKFPVYFTKFEVQDYLKANGIKTD